MKTETYCRSAAPKDSHRHETRKVEAGVEHHPNSRTEVMPPTPADVFAKSGLDTRAPSDSTEARDRCLDPYYLAREEQNNSIAEAICNGVYIRDPETFVEENNRRFPKFALGMGESIFSPIISRMSSMLASIDSPENTIWGEDGFAVDYRFPETDDRLLGKYHAGVLDHFCFTAMTAAWRGSTSWSMGCSLEAISHRPSASISRCLWVPTV